MHLWTREQLCALVSAAEKEKCHINGKLGGTVVGHLEGKE
jgi:hypothetical protein